MTLTASVFDTDLHSMTLLKKLFWQALPTKTPFWLPSRRCGLSPHGLQWSIK